MVVNKLINNKEPVNNVEEQPKEETKVDVSNITDNIVIEGASREMNVLNNDDATKILSEMFIKSMDTYAFSFDTEESNGKIVLSGYNEILDNIFTTNGKKQFEDFYKEVIEKEGNIVYLNDISLIKDELDYTFDISDKDIKETEIISKVKVTYNGIEKEEETFSIKKVDNIWKVDNFSCPF